MNNSLLSHFKDVRVLVTGHTGFKGTWLTQLLHRAGATLAGYSLPQDCDGSHFQQLQLENQIHHVDGDVRCASTLQEVMLEFQPQVVFHLAAQPLVRQSYEDPAQTLDTNVRGGWNVLEAVRQCDAVQALVFITSDKCYENLNWIWGYRESDQLGGHDPYSASKGAMELIFSAYLRSYFECREGFGAVTVRAGNVIGGGDRAPDRIVPDCIRSIMNDLPVSIRNPNATRPWQHVLEPLSGYVTIAHHLLKDPKRFSGAWNFGPRSGDVTTVLELAEELISQLGRGEIRVSSERSKQHEAQLLQLNCDKAQQLLGWQPRWSARQAIHATAEWYQNVLFDSQTMAEVTNRQIDQYLEDADD